MERHLHEAIVSLSRDNRLPEDSHQTMAAVLIPIEDHQVGAEQVPAVSARSLYAWLESPENFFSWIESRIVRFGFVRDTDFALHEIMEPDSRGLRGQQGRNDYYLTLDMAKELALVERNEKGRQARQYFITSERRLKANGAGADPLKALSDPQQLRTLLLGFTERLIALEAKAAEDAQKLAFQDAQDTITQATNTQSVQSVAKVLGIGSVKFFEWLRRAGILMHNNLPYQCHIDSGYFKVVQRSFVGKNDQKQLYARTLVTGKGFAYLQRRYQAAQHTPEHA
ncbi:MAG: antA/AntB antirepressor family protein [Proteobacteria bacterium]|nr:antA/AntB antirepressor family protein [Pseudomonadota bacterium]